jgi:DNA invertase Pin-like site-specific DNA recombinase
VLLDVQEVVLPALDDGEELRHRRDLLALLLKEPVLGLDIARKSLILRVGSHERRVAMSPEKKPTKPIDVYIRVSRVGDRDRESDSFQSPKQQETRCRAQLKADGLKVGQVFTDLDESGAKASRPAFDEMLARIESGASGGVAVHDLSRFGRSTRNVLDGIDFIEEHGGVFLSCAEKFDTSTANGRFVLTMFAALRELERNQSAERWEVSKADARARGIHIGGPRAGYIRQADGKLAEHPEHIEAVKAVFALRARGGSWREAAAILTEAGVPTSKSGGEAVEWSRQATRNVVQNAAYREDEGGPIPVWQWRKAQPKPGEARVRGEGHVLGAGLVRCSVCGAAMHKSSNGQKYVVLRCDTAGSGHPTISFETARDYILSLAFSHLGTLAKRRPGGDESERDALRLAVEEARARAEQVEALIGERVSSTSKQAVALTDAQAALAEFETAAGAPLGLADLLTPVGVREEFERLPIPEQRRVLRSIVARVVLSPGRNKPGERIVVDFVDGDRWPAPQGEVPVVAS